MQFDPSIAAQDSFTRAQQTGELGADLDAAREAEDLFSSTADASAAYHVLQGIGERHPDARALQEFLIYITWQQVTEETISIHFKKGLELCNQYLDKWPAEGEDASRQILELRSSFRAGLGLDEEDDEFDQDTFKGGD